MSDYLNKWDKRIDFEILRKYVACFGLLSCPTDSECPFSEWCRTECLSKVENMKRAIDNLARRKR